MIEYTAVKLDNSKAYEFEKSEGMCSKKFGKTKKNLQDMLSTGHPVTLIIPNELLSEEEQEKYRQFFCKEAKEKGENFIYFTGPVTYREVDPMEGTMFDF